MAPKSTSKGKSVKSKPVKRSTPKPKVKPIVKNYDQDFEYICLEIEKGFALRKICPSFMSLEKFYSLLQESDAKSKRYARACEERAESIFEDIIEIADSSNADLSLFEGKIIIDGEAIQRSKLKIDARKWILSKLNPKKYGDKMQIDAVVTNIPLMSFDPLADIQNDSADDSAS